MSAEAGYDAAAWIGGSAPATPTSTLSHPRDDDDYSECLTLIAFAVCRGT